MNSFENQEKIIENAPAGTLTFVKKFIENGKAVTLAKISILQGNEKPNYIKAINYIKKYI
jgi:hypothetical protein